MKIFAISRKHLHYFMTCIFIAELSVKMSPSLVLVNTSFMHDIESRISAIESRNARVATDKAWETSFTRKFSILVMTYCILGIYMKLLGIEKWYFHALVPTCGYFLSTLALPVIRTLWERTK